MKMFLVALISFLLIAVFVITNAVVCTQKAETLVESAEEVYRFTKEHDVTSSKEEIKALEADWERFLPYLKFTLHHNYLTPIENIFTSVDAATASQDKSMLLLFLSQLKGAFTELHEVLSKPQF